MWNPFKKKQPKPVQRKYAGAVVSRLTSDWIMSATSQDTEVRSSLPILRDRSRSLCRDNDYARSAIRTIRNNVVGQGIGFQSLIPMKRGGGKLNETLNSTIEAAWCKWGQKKNCHMAGILGFSDIERLIIDSVATSGEILIRKIYQQRGNSKVPLSLEILESDMLDDTYNSSLGQNTVRMGVELDPWKRPVAYHFHARHPGDFFQANSYERTGLRIRVPANEIFHLFLTDRVGQNRGIPWLASAMMRLRHMAGFEESEVVAARAGASIMGWVKTVNGEVPADDKVAGDNVMDFAAGEIRHLGQDEDIVVPDMHRPNGAFDPFMRAMIRAVAAGIGVSYESISRDYSQSNYSSSRLALLDDRDNWRVLQDWLVKNFHQPLFEEWLDFAVLSGEVPIAGYETNSDFYKMPRWIARGWSWVDPAKEVAAYKEAVRSGFKTVTDVIAESGGDIEDTFAQRKRELEMAKEMGIVLDTDPSQVNDKGATQATPATVDDAASQPAAAPAAKPAPVKKSR